MNLKKVIMAKLGEIALKGLNRRAFESMLMKNIHSSIKACGKFDLYSKQSIIYITPLDDDCDMDEALERVGKVFGIATYSMAQLAEKNLDDINKTAAEYLEDELRGVKTFKVEAKRADKTFPLKSPELAAEVGGFLLEKFSHLKVDVKNPDLIVWVEVREKAAYIHGKNHKGVGGIPVGSGGDALILISGGIDSPVAAWQLARRGVKLTAIHFASPPYTSPRSLDKVERLLKQVSTYAGEMDMYVASFTKIQEHIRDYCPEELSTVLMRRFMMKVSCEIAKKTGCKALITGESLGQVASQTIQAIACTDAVSDIPVFRPLIGTDKTEIVDVSRKIGTFDISIEPFEDCCTVFTPKHPKTKPIISSLEFAEEKLDCEALINECLENIEVIKISNR